MQICASLTRGGPWVVILEHSRYFVANSFLSQFTFFCVNFWSLKWRSRNFFDKYDVCIFEWLLDWERHVILMIHQSMTHCLGGAPVLSHFFWWVSHWVTHPGGKAGKVNHHQWQKSSLLLFCYCEYNYYEQKHQYVLHQYQFHSFSTNTATFTSAITCY